MAKSKVALPGSDRRAFPGATISGSVDPNEQIEVTVRLRHSTPIDHQKVLDLGRRRPGERQHMSREEFARTHSAHPDDIAKVKAFAQEYGLAVRSVSPEERKVVL